MGTDGIPGGDRLRALAEMIPRKSRVADIGTDHALLPRLLLSQGRAAFCIATEVTPAALTRLREQIGHRTLPTNLELRAGDGLAPLRPSDRLDVLVLAGIGSRTQVRILSDRKLADLGISRLVLQPQGEPAILRHWLADNRYRIGTERLQEIRGQFHLTMAATPCDQESEAGHPLLTGEDLMVAGPVLTRSGDPLVRRYWEIQFRRLQRLETAGVRGSGGRQVTLDREQAERVLEALPADAL